ncbi:MAG TPA: glycosyltransferase, partial [Acidimicrobiales bacterium]|nr:glycosyltransferase [Acidimicrobiales bacterium]
IARALLVVSSLRPGGAERVIVNIARHLDRSRFEPILAVGTPEGHYLQDVPPDVIMVTLGSERSRRAGPKLVRTVRQIRPDVVLSTTGLNWATAVTRGLFPVGTRVVLREGNSPSAFLDDVAATRPAAARVYRHLYPWVYGRADAVICQSEFMRHDLLATFGLSSDLISVIPNPIDTEAVQERARDDAPVAGVPGTHLVAVGRLAHQKGIDVLLRSLALLAERSIRPHLWILGEGPERQALEQLAINLGVREQVHFEGVVSNPFAYVSRADLFVSASRYEGLSNAVIESLVCGTPVVATDCPSGIRETLEIGATGWLCPPEDPKALSEAISVAITSGSSLSRQEISAGASVRWGAKTVIRAYERVLLARPEEARCGARAGTG